METQRKPTSLCHGALFSFELRDSSMFIYIFIPILFLFCYLDRQLSSFTVLLKIEQAFRRNLHSGHLGITFGAPLSVYSCKVMVEQSKNYFSLAQQHLLCRLRQELQFLYGRRKEFSCCFYGSLCSRRGRNYPIKKKERSF